MARFRKGLSIEAINSSMPAVERRFGRNRDLSVTGHLVGSKLPKECFAGKMGCNLQSVCRIVMIAPQKVRLS